MKKVLEINHCNKSFGDNEVLKDISLSVSEGQVVSIIGPSGSGKSTLLRCATLLETMDGGVIVEEGDPQQIINNPQQDRTKAFLSRFQQ